MGWVESPPSYFCAATEMVRDVSTEYINMEVGLLPTHKFEKYVVSNDDYVTLPDSTATKTGFLCMVKVYVDDFMSLVIPVSQEQLWHVATTIMTGIHDVFPQDGVDSGNPIS